MEPLNIAVTVCATRKYMYAMKAQARRVQAACQSYSRGHIILAGNDEAAMKDIRDLYKELLPSWIPWMIYADLKDDLKNYKEEAQLLIAQMRTAAFAKARTLDVDYCWSLDSDVLPWANALKCSLWSLGFDDGYYGIAACPYPSQGGGGFLCGRGTPFAPILPDWYPDERMIPEELKKEVDETRKGIDDAMKALDEKRKTAQNAAEMATETAKLNTFMEKMAKLEEKLREAPPSGNVFSLNAKGWRRRGFLDQAYPAIGHGAMLPSDWCGFGCTLMNRKALAHADWSGYDGRGTEDLFVVWRRWHQMGLRINVLTHCPADHVIRAPGQEGKFICMQVHHETEGECIGHMRFTPKPWYEFSLGEAFNPANDGKFAPPKEEKKDPTPAAEGAPAEKPVEKPAEPTPELKKAFEEALAKPAAPEGTPKPTP